MMLDTLIAFLPAYAILLVAASSPGPSVALLLGIGLGQGRRAALMTTLGIAFGSTTINVLTLVGVGLFLANAAWAMSLLRMIGAAYLTWLAYRAFRNALHPPNVAIARIAVQPAWKLALTGYLLQVSNPKAIVFWLAIAALNVTAGGGAGVIAGFIAGAFLISFTCHGAWALVLSAQPVRLGYQHARRWIEAVLGTLFAFFAFKLAAERG